MSYRVTIEKKTGKPITETVSDTLADMLKEAIKNGKTSFSGEDPRTGQFVSLNWEEHMKVSISPFPTGGALII